MAREATDRTDAAPADILDRVIAVLDNHGLDPSPAHYEVVYDYLVGSDPELTHRVDEAIARNGQLTAGAIAGIITLRRAAMAAADVAFVTVEAQAHLRQVAEIVDRSGCTRLQRGAVAAE